MAYEDGSLGDDVVQLLSCVPTLCDPWTAHQASLFPTISWSLPKFMSIESVMSSNHLILCYPLLLLLSVFSIIRVSSNESVLRIRWPNYWSSSCRISPSNEYSGFISPCYSLELCIQMRISFLFSFFPSLLFTAICKDPQTAILPFCISFPWGWS